MANSLCEYVWQRCRPVCEAFAFWGEALEVCADVIASRVRVMYFCSLGSWASPDALVNSTMSWTRISGMMCTVCGINPNLFRPCLCDRVICSSQWGFILMKMQMKWKNVVNGESSWKGEWGVSHVFEYLFRSFVGQSKSVSYSEYFGIPVWLEGSVWNQYVYLVTYLWVWADTKCDSTYRVDT